jgi:anti-anti-sigma regulatory factor
VAPTTLGTASAGAPKPAARATGRTGNEEFHSTPLSVAQEAAVLFAANHAAAAEAVLRAETRDPAGRTNRQAWLMLFDLFEIAQNRTEFDALSMLYTVRFEQSPPVWAGGAEAAQDPRRAQSRERKDFFALKPSATGELAVEIEKFLAFAEDMGAVRLDAGKVTSITATEAELLTVALQRLRRLKTPMWFNSMDSLERVLRGAFNERVSEATKPFWLLLFELYILQGNGEAFEELGLEYAVAYEVSPPNWEIYVNSVAHAATKSAPAAQAEPEPGFCLRGVISPASGNQFAELAGYAAAQEEAVVDMSKVLRIDFSACHQFFEVVKAIQLGGKRVILSNLSELNAALLEAFGFNRHAILIRRKAN